MRKRDKEAVTEIALLLGEQIRGWHPSIRHTVEHRVSYDKYPRATLAYFEIFNPLGEAWRTTPYPLARGMDYVKLPGFPIAWLTGRQEDATLGQTSIALKLEYRDGER